MEGLEIGQYIIRKYMGLGGGYWVEHESGEGMQVPAHSLEELIDKFYKENF